MRKTIAMKDNFGDETKLTLIKESGTLGIHNLRKFDAVSISNYFFFDELVPHLDTFKEIVREIEKRTKEGSSEDE